MADPDERLAEIVTALEAVELNCLVMGGHAVRFYGLHRHTDDFDLCLAPDHWDELPSRLAQSRLFIDQRLIEGTTWRKNAFRRFRMGQLPDGRELWLEFWRENHLLAPFPELFARRESGPYGGRRLAFLSLPDLIRSKETERDKDWHDVETLEEFLGERAAVQVTRGLAKLVDALAHVRVRRGIESFLRYNLLANEVEVRAAIERAQSGVVAACLLPFAPKASCPPFPGVLEPFVEDRLRHTPPMDRIHLGLVGVVRKRYMERAKEIDKADKISIRTANKAAENLAGGDGQ